MNDLMCTVSRIALAAPDSCCFNPNGVAVPLSAQGGEYGHRLRDICMLPHGWVSLAPHCFLQLSSAGLIFVLVPGCCWEYSASPVLHIVYIYIYVTCMPRVGTIRVITPCRSLWNHLLSRI